MRRRILNTMKRLEIVLEHEQLPAVKRVLEMHSTGYTVVPGVTGFGHHGHCTEGIVLLVTVVTRDHVDSIVDELVPMLDGRRGVMLLTDVQVLRGEYFVPEVKDRVTADRFIRDRPAI